MNFARKPTIKKLEFSIPTNDTSDKDKIKMWKTSKVHFAIIEEIFLPNQKMKKLKIMMKLLSDIINKNLMRKLKKLK